MDNQNNMTIEEASKLMGVSRQILDSAFEADEEEC